MANVALAGNNYNDVPYMDVPDGASGTSRFWDMYGDYGFLGWNAQHVQQVYTKDYKLSETDFNTWTPSTTAADIVDSASAGTFVADLDSYEYYLKWSFDYQPTFVAGATMKAQITRECASQWQSIHRRPYGLTRFPTYEDYYAYCATLVSASSYLFYYSTSGTASWTTTNSYGIYPTLTAATFSSTSSASPTVTMNAPKVRARCYSSYFSTTRAAEVDKANSYIKIRGDLFRVDKNATMLKQAYIDALNIYNNPL